MISSRRCSGLVRANKRYGWKRPSKSWAEYALALHTFRKFSGHARVHLNDRAVLCLLQYPYSQIPSTRTDFEDLVRWTEVGLECKFILVSNR